MDKIREEFEKWRESIFGISIGGTSYPYEAMYKSYLTGKKSANLLPTEKVCPKCGGSGEIDTTIYDSNPKQANCPKCKGLGTVPIYYPPEQYEKIMGKPYSDDALVWCKVNFLQESVYEAITYKVSDLYVNNREMNVLIVQTAQPAPPADYKLEKEINEEKFYCWMCGKVEIPEPVGCCSGKECGCMGLPIDPPFCCEKCQKEYYSKELNKL